MCGIVGVLTTGKSVEAPILARMQNAVAHRGPDAHASWIDGPIGLGHQRLSIIDTSHASDQPMHSHDGRYVIVFNGAIYNYVELRTQLVIAGYTFKTSGDTEVLIAALQHWGEGALLRLNGMFAFALWDKRDKTLMLVRDRFGEKPLFWAKPRDGGLVFGSEMKALTRHPGVSTNVDLGTLEEFSRGAYFENGPRTMFEDIKRVSGAHFMVFDFRGNLLKEKRYWTPDYDKVDTTLSRADATARFEELLNHAIDIRLRADVPVGSSLSGGLDSSTIVGLLAQRRNEGKLAQQHTFSARFPNDPTLSECAFIDAVTSHTGVTNHSVAPDPIEMIGELDRLHYHQEEPLLSASIYLQWCVARNAKQTGITVLMDGQGADELLGGYQFYFKSYQHDLAELGHFDELERMTRLFNERMHAAAGQYQESHRRFNASSGYSLEELEALKRNPGVGSDGPYPSGVPKAAPGNRVRRIMAEAMQWNSLPLLLRYADRNSMAFAIEGRLPYLDYDLVDFCIQQPDTLYFQDGWQKNVLRDVADKVVPTTVSRRADKMGYAAPLDVWMRGPIKDWAQQRVFEGRVREYPGFDEANLRQMWKEHQSGVANHSWALWRSASLNEWLDLTASGAWTA
jgi:asparagine synthase (glutamine-hydrolysing)